MLIPSNNQATSCRYSRGYQVWQRRLHFSHSKLTTKHNSTTIKQLRVYSRGSSERSSQFRKAPHCHFLANNLQVEMTFHNFILTDETDHQSNKPPPPKKKARPDHHLFETLIPVLGHFIYACDTTSKVLYLVLNLHQFSSSLVSNSSQTFQTTTFIKKTVIDHIVTNPLPRKTWKDNKRDL
jgi:hypothetical protein